MPMTQVSKPYETTSASAHRRERLLTMYDTDESRPSDPRVWGAPQVGITLPARSSEPDAGHETGDAAQLLLESDIQFVTAYYSLSKRLGEIIQRLPSMDNILDVDQTEESTTQVSRMTEEMLLPWDGQIELAKSCKEVVAIMEQGNVDPQITERITYLDGLARDDPDDPSINLESLQKFAAFITTRRHLPCPRMGLTPEGFVEIVWDTSDGDMLSMYFLPMGDVRFAVILATSEDMPRQRSLGGLLPPDDMMNAVRKFVGKLIPA